MAVTKIRKTSSSVLLIIAIVTVAVFGLFLFGGYIDPSAAKPEPRYTDVLLYLCYGILILAIAVMVGFAIWTFAQKLRTNPKGALGALLVIVALAAMLGTTYALGGTQPLRFSGDFVQYNTDHYLKFSDMWILSIYIMLGLTIVAMIWGAIYSSIKGRK
ncbi:MAG: hypothetical protein Q4D93_01920 [Porphyromonas sp.]|nr:hypothetical protein [Porphyromonas sp.]